jgi:type II secretory ATPase GspE/PulE/Tfp pilus assembly ATPase PilB-like protein
MVGEIRDAEVAQIAGQAANTGHLVLTSMHTLDAATAVTRLHNLGFQPFKIAECLSAVLAQRLLRSLCPSCKKMNNELEARRLGAAHHLAAVPASPGPGCEHCRHTGYGGRVPIAELITPSDELREAMVGGAAAHDIRAAMRASGMPTMHDHAMRLVSEGLTSIRKSTAPSPRTSTARSRPAASGRACSSRTTNRSRGCSSSCCSSARTSTCSRRRTASRRWTSPRGSGRT